MTPKPGDTLEFAAGHFESDYAGIVFVPMTIRGAGADATIFTTTESGFDIYPTASGTVIKGISVFLDQPPYDQEIRERIERRLGQLQEDWEKAAEPHLVRDDVYRDVVFHSADCTNRFRAVVSASMAGSELLHPTHVMAQESQRGYYHDAEPELRLEAQQRSDLSFWSGVNIWQVLQEQLALNAGDELVRRAVVETAVFGVLPATDTPDAAAMEAELRARILLLGNRWDLIRSSWRADGEEGLDELVSQTLRRQRELFSDDAQAAFVVAPEPIPAEFSETAPTPEGGQYRLILSEVGGVKYEYMVRGERALGGVTRIDRTLAVEIMERWYALADASGAKLGLQQGIERPVAEQHGPARRGRDRLRQRRRCTLRRAGWAAPAGPVRHRSAALARADRAG